MSQSQKQEPTPSSISFVPTAMYRLDPEGECEEGVVNSKCTDCDLITNHQWMKVYVDPTEENTQDIEEVRKLTRRIVMCTQCGKLALKK